jgi:hypothetical protein
VSFIVCVVLCAVFRLIMVLFCVMCVICLLCLTVLPLPPGKNQFAVKINNNNNNNNNNSQAEFSVFRHSATNTVYCARADFVFK